MRKLRYLVFTEFAKSWRSPLVYILLSAYLFLSGFLFLSLIKEAYASQRGFEGSQTELSYNAAIIQPLIESQAVLLLFIIPFITMRSFAEERMKGSLDLLLISPTSSALLCVAKVTASFCVLIIAVIMGALYPLSICILAKPELLPVFSGIFGLTIFVFAFSALGVLISSLCASPIVAGLASLTISLLWFLMDTVLPNQGVGLLSWLTEASVAHHLSGLAQGVVSVLSVYFFVAIGVLFLVVNVFILDRNRGSF